jgi:hypothetical protein
MHNLTSSLPSAPSSLPHANAPFIVFSDFDGTITTCALLSRFLFSCSLLTYSLNREDSNDAATDNVRFGTQLNRRTGRQKRDLTPDDISLSSTSLDLDWRSDEH